MNNTVGANTCPKYKVIEVNRQVLGFAIKPNNVTNCFES